MFGRVAVIQQHTLLLFASILYFSSSLLLLVIKYLYYLLLLVVVVVVLLIVCCSPENLVPPQHVRMRTSSRISDRLSTFLQCCWEHPKYLLCQRRMSKDLIEPNAKEKAKTASKGERRFGGIVRGSLQCAEKCRNR